MCYCKEPKREGWTHGETSCYNTKAMGHLFEPFRSKGRDA